jgi:hypothetical protein
MIFIDNKYTRIYFRIVSKSIPKIGYTETHHIIPKSLGGSNEPSNLVKLTPKEHYICHLLLIKMVAGKAKTSMRYAFYMMSKRNPHQQNRIKVSSRQYVFMKEQMILANKERLGPNKGKKNLPETNAKISASLKGKSKPKRSKEHSEKLGKFEKTLEYRNKISQARKAQKGLQVRSDETKKKMSAWQKGIPKEKHKCIHCGKEASFTNIARWHNDKCKFQ